MKYLQTHLGLPPRRSSLLLWAIVLMLPLGLLSGCAAGPGPGPSARGHGRAGYSFQRLDSEERSASVPSSSTRPFWNEPAPEVLAQARHLEAERTLRTLWAVAGTTNAVDAEWEFHFWSQGGALTLLSFRRTEEGEGRAAPISRGAFLPRLSRELPTLLGSHPRDVTLTLERGETRWSADLETSPRDTPPAWARTLPSTRGGTSEQTHRQVLETARRMSGLMTVPRGGSSRLEAQVTLEDHRIVSWEPAEFDSSGDGPALKVSDEAVTVVLEALLPFTQGLGERTVRLSFEGEHRHGEARPRWSTVAARTLEPLPPPREVADIHQEYRALHEHILFEFQEQSRETAILAAGFTLEQLAYGLVGGLLLKGTLVVFGRVAPIITSVLSRGGKGAVSWFRTLLARAPQQERELLRQLWVKVETQGIQSLTKAEQQQLHAVMGRLERVLGTPLDDIARKTLRTWSREDYFELYNPELAKALGSQGLRTYQVHHVCPLEYAHLFPKLDINGKANLVGVHQDVHQGISAIWSALRQDRVRMKAQDVTRVVEIVERHYGRWFHKVYEHRDAAALTSARQAALSEVAQVKALLSP